MISPGWALSDQYKTSMSGEVRTDKAVGIIIESKLDSDLQAVLRGRIGFESDRPCRPARFPNSISQVKIS